MDVYKSEFVVGRFVCEVSFKPAQSNAAAWKLGKKS
jgi:hypothetical protein